MRKWIPLLLLIGVAGCAKVAPPGAAPSARSEAAATPAAPPNNGAGDSQVMTIPQLAYAYAYKLSLPADQIQKALERDEQACAAAGPLACQLVGSHLDRESDSVAGAHLELRAVPSFIAGFRQSVEGEAKAAGGHVRAAEVESEDLSRQIVDTDAAVRAQTTLRDRIEKVLAERPGKLADVMDAEHELAKAQGDLDATKSELAVMRTRVATSKLTVDYEAAGLMAPDGLLRPLRDAALGAGRNMVGVLAGIVTLASFLLPMVAAGGVLVVLAMTTRSWLRAGARRRAAASR